LNNLCIFFSLEGCLGWWKEKRSCGVDDRLVALGRTALAMVMNVVFVSLAIGLGQAEAA
jgi:hypothetical protein